MDYTYDDLDLVYRDETGKDYDESEIDLDAIEEEFEDED